MDNVVQMCHILCNPMCTIDKRYFSRFRNNNSRFSFMKRKYYDNYVGINYCNIIYFVVPITHMSI